MFQIFEALKNLQGSYSGAFVLFWGVMLVACVGVRAIESSKSSIATKVETTLFWLFGLAMVVFAALRPIGIARDDLPYLDIYNTVCPTLTCGQWIQGTRDWGWYSLVGLLKSVSPTPRVMLGIAALALLMKLWVIFRVSRAPLMALLLFTGVFYEMQDLTAFRVSLSLAFFMFAIWVWMARGSLLGGVSLLLPGLFHKQGFLSVGLILAPLFKRWYWVLVVSMVAPVVMLWTLDKPVLPAWLISQEDMLMQHAVQQGLDSYLSGQAAGLFKADRLIPIVFYPLIGLGIWLAKDVFLLNRRLYSLIASSMAIACWLMWLFAAMTPAQVRFFEFFMLPMVLLAGCAQRSWINISALAIVSGVWLVRHNVLHPLVI